MRLEESVVALLLLGLIARPGAISRLSTPGGKMLLLAVVAYLANHDALLGCLAAVLVVRVMRKEPTNTWRPPRTDRLGMDALLRPQESFFKPVLRMAGDPVAEPETPYTLF